MNRNQFLKNAAFLGLGPIFPNLSNSNHRTYQEILFEIKKLDFSDPKDEKTWAKAQDLFPKKPDFIQLEHGYFSHAFLNVLEIENKELEIIQKESSYYMRIKQEELLENSRLKLSQYLGFEKEELAITRNTTESLNIVFNGIDWKKNDEIIIGNQDYGSMVESINQLAQRYHIKVKIAQIPINPTNDEEIISAYTQLINKKSKLVLITHLINLSGQIIPIEKINDQIKKIDHRIITVSDSAHSVSQIDFDFKNSKIDIFAGSLHKWTCCSIGLGFLKIKKELIPQIWPLFGDTNYPKDNIRKFEHFGTRPLQVYKALNTAIENNSVFGSIKNKELRLQYLQQYWRNKVDLQKFSFNTPQDEKRYAAISNIASRLEQYKLPQNLSEFLWKEYRIFSVAINHEIIKGVRITPHLTTNIEELDQLVYALNQL